MSTIATNTAGANGAQRPPTDFQAKFFDQTRPVDLNGIDFGRFERGLSDDVLRCLSSFQDIEYHTSRYVSDALIASNAQDHPGLAEFLIGWAYEETHHGTAIARVLDAAGWPNGPMRHLTHTNPRARDRLTHIGLALTNSLGIDFYPLHMAIGAANEWLARASYLRLGALSGSRDLQLLLGRIANQESRHAAYYASAAREFLHGHPHHRRAVRWMMRRFWRPVGTNILDASEQRHHAAFLFSGAEGAAILDRVDRRIGTITGLEGLSLVRQAYAGIFGGALAVRRQAPVTDA